MPTDLDILLRRIWQEERLASRATDPRASAAHASLAESYHGQVHDLLREASEPAAVPARAEMPARFRRGFAVLHGNVEARPGFLADLGG